MSKNNKFTGESNAKNRRLEQSEQHTYSASQFTADLTMQEVDQFRNHLSSITSKGRGVEFQSLCAWSCLQSETRFCATDTEKVELVNPEAVGL